MSEQSQQDPASPSVSSSDHRDGNNLYYERLHREYAYLQRREDQFFLFSLLLIAGAPFLLVARSQGPGLFVKILCIGALAALGWAVLSFLQENAVFKGDVHNKLQELAEKQHIPNVSGVNTKEFWKEDFFQMVLKLAVLGSSVIVLFT